MCYLEIKASWMRAVCTFGIRAARTKIKLASPLPPAQPVTNYVKIRSEATDGPLSIYVCFAQRTTAMLLPQRKLECCVWSSETFVHAQCA
jgi:hypothetical protein